MVRREEEGESQTGRMTVRVNECVGGVGEQGGVGWASQLEHDKKGNCNAGSPISSFYASPTAIRALADILPPS